MKVLRGSLLTAGSILILAGIAFWLRPLDFYDDFTYLQGFTHGVQNRWTWVGGYRMHYEVVGPASGPPVVLIHGLGGSAEDWRTLAPYFARAGFRVYMPDLIGYGRSAQPADFSYSIRDEAELVADFLDNAGLKRVDLGGWSMGGRVAQMVAYRHPDRIKRLVLFDSAGLYVEPSWDTRLFTPTTVKQINDLDALLMPHPPRIPGFIANDILRVSKESNWVVSRALAQMYTARDVTDNLLPQLKMPVLIEWGAEDRIIPLNQAESIHRLVPQSQLQVYAGCGHLAPLQCARQIGPNVVRFLKQSPVPSESAPGPSLAAKPMPDRPMQSRGEDAHLEASRNSAAAGSAQN